MGSGWPMVRGEAQWGKRGPRGRGWRRGSSGVAAIVAGAVSLLPAAARGQDRAVVDVGNVGGEGGGFAPPPSPPVRAVDRDRPPPDDAPQDAVQAAPEPVRSALRLEVGPAAATTGRGLGAGLGAAADFGSGTLGFRLAGAWLRGEPSSGSPSSTSPLGGGLAQYTGELTVDFARRGPWHPVLGVGFGFARVDTGRAAGGMGIGTARLGLEYALAFDDVDLRFGAGVLAALPGPADGAVSDVKGWAVLGASVAVGF